MFPRGIKLQQRSGCFTNSSGTSSNERDGKKKKKDYSSQSDLELLRAFAGLQTDDDVADGFSIAPHGILSLTGGQLCHLPFIHLLCFFDTQS